MGGTVQVRDGTGESPWHEAGVAGRTGRRGGTDPMVIWWSALGVLLAVVYMVAYTLLRTSGDGRRWTSRLRHPRSPRPDPVRAPRLPSEARIPRGRSGHHYGGPAATQDDERSR